MTITEKIAELTPEQREKFDALSTPSELEEFLSEYKLELTDEEKEKAIYYIENGKLPLSDDELENVAGGCIDYSSMNPRGEHCPKCYSIRIKVERRVINCSVPSVGKADGMMFSATEDRDFWLENGRCFDCCREWEKKYPYTGE